MLLDVIFRNRIATGALQVIDARGSCHTYGDPAAAHPVVVRLHEAWLPARLVARRDLALGEAYMDGTLTIEDGSLYAFLDLLATAGPSASFPNDRVWRGLRRAGRWIRQFNPRALARRRVGYHYDFDLRFYDLFLDADRQYSCAYFERPDMGLEAAQAAKKELIARKLLLEPGMRVLDIGCGWGGLALHLARAYGVSVTGITLSRSQVVEALRRSVDAGLADRVSFLYEDYRELRGPFERIVSIGMFEHVGRPHYRHFFTKIRDLLTDDGVALVHSIGRVDGPGFSHPWIRKHVFPGGYIPALSEMVRPVERARLWITDVEVLRGHYAQTLREWRRRFAASHDVAVALYGERFCRMWEFYLTGAEIAFRRWGRMVLQLQLAKSAEAVPTTRTYLVSREPRSADHGPSGWTPVQPAAALTAPRGATHRVRARLRG